MKRTDEDRIIYPAGYTQPKPPAPPEVQCALLAPRMIAAIVWRLCGGSEESCPFKLKDFL